MWATWSQEAHSRLLNLSMIRARMRVTFWQSGLLLLTHPTRVTQRRLQPAKWTGKLRPNSSQSLPSWTKWQVVDFISLPCKWFLTCNLEGECKRQWVLWTMPTKRRICISSGLQASSMNKSTCQLSKTSIPMPILATSLWWTKEKCSSLQSRL